MRKNNFDESVKRILGQNEFAYDPAAWEQAQKLLVQEPSRRLGGLWWTLLFVAISGIVGAGISGIRELQLTPQNQSLIRTAEARATTDQANITVKTNVQTADAPPMPTTTPVLGDSVHKPAKKIVRFIHPAKEAEAPTDTIRQPKATSELATIIQLKAAQLTPRNNYLAFSAHLRDLPTYDYTYETRPGFRAQNEIMAFAWAGQQGRNTESSLLQQQYGLGLAWQRELLPNFGIQLGAALGYNNGFAYSSRQSDTSYAFGRTVTTQTAIVQDYMQIQLPVGLNYRFAGKHQIELGAAYQRYLGSRYRLQTDFMAADGTNSSNSNPLSGKIAGLQIPSWSWFTAYRFHLNEAFDLGLRYQQHTTVGTAFPAEKSFRVVLHYHLYRFTL